MKTKRMVAGKDWEFDGSTITIQIPMTWKRRGGRKVIIAPEGGDAWAPAKPRRDETLIRALARAHRWKRMLEDGTHHLDQRFGRGGVDQPCLCLPAAQPHTSLARDHRSRA